MTKENLTNLFNGAYLLVNKGEQDVLLELINTIGVDNPLVVSVLSHHALSAKEASEILAKCFEVVRNYYGRTLSEAEWAGLIDTVNGMPSQFSDSGKTYISRILGCLISEIELKQAVA